MSSEPYTPTPAMVRAAWKAYAPDPSGLNRDGTEFDRFISKVRADARIAAWKEVAEFMRNQTSDDAAVLRAAHLAATTIYYRVSQIEADSDE